MLPCSRLLPLSLLGLITYIGLHNFNSTDPPYKSIPGDHTSHPPATPTHPLDPLTFQEIAAIKSTLSSHPPFSASNPFPIINSLLLDEPDKSVVRSWLPGSPLPSRRASVIATSRNQTHILTVDVAQKSVLQHAINPHPSGYPILTPEELRRAESVALADRAFVWAIRSRGVEPGKVTCGPLSPGWYGKEEEGFRLVKVQCYLNDNSSDFYMRPIEGLTAFVNLDAGKVVKINHRDRDVPIRPSEGDTDFRYEVQRDKPAPHGLPLNPMSMEQQKGKSFVIDGHVVRWGGWEFHLRPCPRAGMVVSRARFVDPESGELRDVMYKGMVSELFVPYMDPTEWWYFKTYLDAGEYGFGLSALPLVRLNDCPRNAEYMDAVFYGSDGSPFLREDLICVFEKYDGDIAWRHSENLADGTKVNNKSTIRFLFQVPICVIQTSTASHPRDPVSTHLVEVPLSSIKKNSGSHQKTSI